MRRDKEILVDIRLRYWYNELTSQVILKLFGGIDSILLLKDLPRSFGIQLKQPFKEFEQCVHLC